MDDLKLIITLHGLGWGSSAKATEDDYIRLQYEIITFLEKSNFVQSMKTATVSIVGYEPKRKSILVTNK